MSGVLETSLTEADQTLLLVAQRATWLPVPLTNIYLAICFKTWNGTVLIHVSYSYATLDTVLTHTMVGTKHQKATTLLVGDNREFKGISWMVLLLAR